MTSASTPALALSRLGELSFDVRAGVVLDAEGERLAGPPDLAGPAAELLRLAGALARAAADPGAGPVDAVEAVLETGAVFAVRSARFALAVAAERTAVASVLLWDLRRVLAELEQGAR